MTSDAQSSTVPAGWYADPSGLPAQRWWDGGQWTSHVQPAATAVPPPVTPAGDYASMPPSGPALDTRHTPAPEEVAATVRGAEPGRFTFLPGTAAPSPYVMQPTDAVSAQLGYAQPDGLRPQVAARRRGDRGPGADPSRWALRAGALSLLVNPLLLTSVAAVVLALITLRRDGATPNARWDARVAMILAGVGATIGAAVLIWLLRTV